MAKKLYVGNIPFGMTEDQVGQEFSKFTVKSAKIVTDRETGRSRGFAFVEVEDGDNAIKEMNGKTITNNGKSRDIVVNEAREREARPARSDNRDRSDYNRR